MIAATPLMQVAVGYSHTLECVVDFYQNGVLTWAGAPVISGSITADRGSKVRTNCDIDVAIEEWADLPIDNKAGRFKVRRGIGTLGYKETIQLGEFRVDDIDRPANGAVSIKGSGLEAYVADARFLTRERRRTDAAPSTSITDPGPGGAAQRRVRSSGTPLTADDRDRHLETGSASTRRRPGPPVSGRRCSRTAPAPG